MIKLIVLAILPYFAFDLARCQQVKTIQIRMPGVTPQKDDDYLCTGVKLDPEENYITKFTVEGTAERAHHMILMGCPELTKTEESWSCGNHGACTGGSSILFAWAKNAPGATLPKDVGFRISGPRSKVKYLILQVHYATKLPPGERDYTGMDLEITSEPQRYIAGIFLMMAMPTIPPFAKNVHADAYCPVDIPAPVKIFAFRVHAHSLGTVVTGYKHDPKTGQVEEIARGNPQWPQAFYSTKKQFDLAKDDSLVARCTYNSDRDVTVETGATANDEMCNLYLMYYTDAEKGSPYQSCSYLPGKRELSWFPADSDVPLPPNPILEDYALHGKNKKHNNNKNHDAAVETNIEHQADHSSTIVSNQPIDLNRVHYKHIFDQQVPQQQPAAQEQATNDGQLVRSGGDEGTDFQTFLAFYRQISQN